MALQLPPQLSLERHLLENLLVSGFIFWLSKQLLFPSGLEWRTPVTRSGSSGGAGRETKAVCPSTNTWKPGVTSQKTDPLMLLGGHCGGPLGSAPLLPTAPLRGYASCSLRHIV